MKQLIPEYKSNNSDYEKFDRRSKVYEKSGSPVTNTMDKTFINL